MGINNDTIQFIAKLFAITVALGLLAIIGTDIGAIFVFGDGEALKLIGMLNGPLITAFGALSAATMGHQLLGTVVQRLFGSGVSVASPGSSINVPVSVPVTLPSMEQAAQPAPAAVAVGSGV